VPEQKPENYYPDEINDRLEYFAMHKTIKS